jgi:hypothetical protein
MGLNSMVVSIDALKESVVILHIGISGFSLRKDLGKVGPGERRRAVRRLGLIIAFKKLFYHALPAYAVPQ